MQSNDKNAVTAKYVPLVSDVQCSLEPCELSSTFCVVCSLKDMLYKRRMERQLAAARGEGPAPERAPDEVVCLLLQSCIHTFGTVHLPMS